MMFALSHVLLLSATLASDKTVRFGGVTDIMEEDLSKSSSSLSSGRPKSILREAGSDATSRSSSRKPSGSQRKSIFDSDSDDDELFADAKPVAHRSKTTESPKPVARTSTSSSSKKPATSITGRSEKKPTAGLSRFKNRGPIANPVLDTLLTVLDTFIGAFQETIRNEFVSEEEVDAYEARHGQIMHRKDPTEMLFRIARPTGWLAANMWAFYDFPGNPMYWGAMLIVNMVAILGWRNYDLDWMVTEMGHWDYALGLAVFIVTGIFSLLHQGVNFLTKIFFAMAPTLILMVYVGILFYAAFKKPHQYYY